MKCIVKNNIKYIIPDALMEKIIKNEASNVENTNDGNKDIDGESSQSQKDDTINGEILSKIGKPYSTDKNDTTQLDTEISNQIDVVKKDLSIRLKNLNQNIIHLLQKKYPSLGKRPSYIDIVSVVLDELDINRQKIIKYVGEIIRSDVKLPISDKSATTVKSYKNNTEEPKTYYGVDKAIRAGIIYYLQETVKNSITQTIENSKEIQKDDVYLIIQSVIKELGAGIFNSKGNMGDVINIDNVDNEYNTEDSEKVWLQFKKKFNELRSLKLYPYDSVYVELINKCVELADNNPIRGNLKKFSQRDVSDLNVHDIYKKDVKKESINSNNLEPGLSNILLEKDNSDNRKRKVRDIIYKIYNRYIKIMSETNSYYMGILKQVENKDNLGNILYDRRIRGKVSKVKDIILNNDTTTVRYVWSFFDRYYGLKTDMFSNMILNLKKSPFDDIIISGDNTNDTEDDKVVSEAVKDNKGISVLGTKEYFEFICFVMKRFNEIVEKSISKKIEAINAIEKLSDANSIIDDVFSKNTLLMYVLSAISIPFSIEVMSFAETAFDKKEDKKYKNKKDITINDRLKNFKTYMGRDPNEEDEIIYAKTVQELYEKIDIMNEIVKSIKEEAYNSAYYVHNINYVIVQNKKIRESILQSIKNFVLNNDSKDYFMRKVLAYEELYKAYEKIKESNQSGDEEDVSTKGIKKLLNKIFGNNDAINPFDKISTLFYKCIIIPNSGASYYSMLNIFSRTQYLTDNYSLTRINDPIPFFQRYVYMIESKKDADFVGYFEVYDFNELYNKVIGKLKNIDIKPVKVI